MKKLGFFSASSLDQSKPPVPMVPRCGSCGLYRHCQSPQMPLFGKGKRKILLVGEAPGKNEDDQNRPFVGDAGECLQENLDKVKIDLERDCWVTNALICRPIDAQGGNATPTQKQIGWCRPNVVNVIRRMKPEIIIPLGGVAVESVIGWLWREKVDTIGRWVGWRIPHQRLNAWICPTFHPSFALRERKQRPVVETYMRRHLRAASRLQGRPWQTIPDYGAIVRCVLDTDVAASHLYDMMQKGGNVAFDFETDRRKPERKDAQIVCCAVCHNGKKTIAYPWLGQAIKATKELLTSDLGKFGWNIQFETRWAYSRLGVEIRNWRWDGMLGAHTQDNRQGTTGLEFQEFVQLGMDSHKEHIAPYLEGEGGNGPNRIKQVNMMDLLKYCGIDATVEYVLDVKQMQQMGAEP